MSVCLLGQHLSTWQNVRLATAHGWKNSANLMRKKLLLITHCILSVRVKPHSGFTSPQISLQTSHAGKSTDLAKWGACLQVDREWQGLGHPLAAAADLHLRDSEVVLNDSCSPGTKLGSSKDHWPEKQEHFLTRLSQCPVAWIQCRPHLLPLQNAGGSHLSDRIWAPNVASFQSPSCSGCPRGHLGVGRCPHSAARLPSLGCR